MSVVSVIGLLISVAGLVVSGVCLVDVILRYQSELRRLREQIRRWAPKSVSAEDQSQEAQDVSARPSPVIQRIDGRNGTVRLRHYIVIPAGLCVGLLILCVTFWTLHRDLVGLLEKNSYLRLDVAYSKKEEHALKEALKSIALLPDIQEWQAEHEEYPVWFWVTDGDDNPIVGCEASVAQTGERAVTLEGGLTGCLLLGLGDRVSVEKAGYLPQDVFLDRDKAGKQIIHVRLRRKNHVNREASE